LPKNPTVAASVSPCAVAADQARTHLPTIRCF
jgi:hypothetical protein